MQVLSGGYSSTYTEMENLIKEAGFENVRALNFPRFTDAIVG